MSDVKLYLREIMTGMMLIALLNKFRLLTVQKRIVTLTKRRRNCARSVFLDKFSVLHGDKRRLTAVLGDSKWF